MSDPVYSEGDFLTKEESEFLAEVAMNSEAMKELAASLARHGNSAEVIVPSLKEILQLQEQVETQQAQIKGLVAGLNRLAEFGSSDGCQHFREAREILSTLPAEFLEKERKREAVIRAAQDVVNKSTVTFEFVCTQAELGLVELTDWYSLLPVLQAVDALD